MMMLFLAAFMYIAGACKTMVDYEIKGFGMWLRLAAWPVFYVWLIGRSFFDE